MKFTDDEWVSIVREAENILFEKTGRRIRFHAVLLDSRYFRDTVWMEKRGDKYYFLHGVECDYYSRTGAVGAALHELCHILDYESCGEKDYFCEYNALRNDVRVNLMVFRISPQIYEQHVKDVVLNAVKGRVTSDDLDMIIKEELLGAWMWMGNGGGTPRIANYPEIYKEYIFFSLAKTDPETLHVSYRVYGK